MVIWYLHMWRDLVNWQFHHLTYLSFWWRNLNIKVLLSEQISFIWYSVTVTMFYIRSLDGIQKLCTLLPAPPYFPHSLTPGILFSTLGFYEVYFFFFFLTFHIRVIPCGVCHSLLYSISILKSSFLIFLLYPSFSHIFLWIIHLYILYVFII